MNPGLFGFPGPYQIKTEEITNLAVTEAKLAASSVSQGKLKTTSGDVSTTSFTGVNLTLAGGSYGFHPQIFSGNAARTCYWGWDYTGSIGIGSQYTNSTSPVTGLYLATGGDAGVPAYARQYYVQASPPYDLGDGKIPLFVFAIMNSDGTIHSTYVAPEAPWHNNGPTSIRPDVEINGRKFQRRRQIIAEFGSVKAALVAGLTRAKIMDRIATDPMVYVEITQAIKQADMPLIPHPFLGNSLTGKTVVLLDPVSPLMQKLFEAYAVGESVTEIVHQWLSIGNTALPRSQPPGVMVVAAALK